MEKFYTLDDYTNNIYYQVPKVLFKGAYKELSNNARILYGLLKDRHELSVKQRWVDDNRRIYFYFDQKKLAEESCISIRSVVKIIKELNDYKLLVSVRQGMNKPNRMYLLRPECDSNEIYKLNNRHEIDRTSHISSEEIEAMPDESRICNSCTSGNAENAHQEVQELHTNENEFKKTEYNQINLIKKDVMSDGIDKSNFSDFENNIKSNIEFNRLVKEYKEKEPLIKNICSTIIYFIMMDEETNKTVRISGKEMPINLVKSRFTSINYEVVVYTLDSLKKAKKITAESSYLTTVLFNNAASLALHESNKNVNLEEKDISLNKTRVSKNTFNNFNQRTYDYEDLEKKLLNAGVTEGV